jgi:DNA-binding NtrC family response regulator
MIGSPLLERAVALTRSDRIGIEDLPAEVGAPSPAVQSDDDVRTLAEVERDYIAAALRASGGNRAKAAEKLGIGVATLYRKLKHAVIRAGALKRLRALARPNHNYEQVANRSPG